jgi:hypothetical protein
MTAYLVLTTIAIVAANELVRWCRWVYHARVTRVSAVRSRMMRARDVDVAAHRVDIALTQPLDLRVQVGDLSDEQGVTS